MLRLISSLLMGVVCLGFFSSSHAFGHNPAAEDLALAATRFLSTLTPEQVKMAKFELKDAERTNYHFVPDRMVSSEGRRGLPIKAMRSDQRALAYAIPASALSHRGYLQATTIMALEKILFDKEKDLIRDPERYYVSIFGTPDAHGTWGWRFEGHHLAINMTIVDGEKFSVTPTFMGTNPGKVSEGMLAGTEVLQQEGDLGLELANSLSAEQMKLALIKDTSGFEVKERDQVVWEILTNQEANVDRKKFAFKGISFNQLNPEQQSMLLKLANLYAGKYRDEVLAGTRYKGKILDGSKLSFAWLGGLKRSQMHYYCIQSDVFVIEYANSRNDVNHAHAVWREFDGDFGRDLLGDHLRDHHQGSK
jgi:hypothetical protein